ncbi:glucose 1-dehydrogenase [Streptomyces marincola]|uniref:Theronine dehydrogenase n=1 Tax=Streptomyces marincola TaxID=2878388 RepID=A0A1W7D167_9ACTN|nr:glucose 1-dehydrogenase [Streptomyces marincola]ARQ70808.1 theronine dehydrogenase [Streptomyces marincola]
MRAVTVRPGRQDAVEVRDVPDPAPGAGELLVEGVAAGVCGTDLDIVAGDYGWAPPGRDRLVLGHESLGRVRHAPDGSGFAPGDLVAGVVRHPDPEPCGACAHGQPDMCRNGRYTERGIKERDGFAAELWCVEPSCAVRLDPCLARGGVLIEPGSVVAKAWEQVERVGARAWFEPRRVLVTGAGPIGLLAALFSVRRGLVTHVLDRVTDGPKPALVRDLGAEYHTGDIADVLAAVRPDVVIEATGAGPLVLGVLTGTDAYGIVCLTGVAPAGRDLTVDAGAVGRDLVLGNRAVVGSVNGNVRHFRQAADTLAAADQDWLERVITRRVPLDRAADAYAAARSGADVKVVIDLDPSAS